MDEDELRGRYLSRVLLPAVFFCPSHTHTALPPLWWLVRRLVLVAARSRMKETQMEMEGRSGQAQGQGHPQSDHTAQTSWCGGPLGGWVPTSLSMLPHTSVGGGTLLPSSPLARPPARTRHRLVVGPGRQIPPLSASPPGSIPSFVCKVMCTGYSLVSSPHYIFFFHCYCCHEQSTTFQFRFTCDHFDTSKHFESPVDDREIHFKSPLAERERERVHHQALARCCASLPAVIRKSSS